MQTNERLSKLGTPIEVIVLSPVSSGPVGDRTADSDGDEIILFGSPDDDFSCGGDFEFANYVDEASNGPRTKKKPKQRAIKKRPSSMKPFHDDLSRLSSSSSYVSIHLTNI